MDEGQSQYDGVSQFDLDVDIEYERQEQEKTVWIGDRHFVDQSWVSCGEDTPLEVDDARPLTLHTYLRHPPGSPEAGKSYAHDCHPFVAFLHLLHAAPESSDIFISIPYLTDFTVVDQLCHYADPSNGGLQIYIVLGPKDWNIECLENFVGRSESRQTAVARLHIKRFGRDDGSVRSSFMHSKAMVSPAGTMIGSYNYTNAARLRHREHAVLLAPGPDFQSDGIRMELQEVWQGVQGNEIQIKRKPSAEKHKAPSGTVYNPYKKSKS